MNAAVLFNGKPLSLDDIADLALEARASKLDADGAYRARIEAGAAFVDQRLASGGEVYGVNTGYGDNVTTRIDAALVKRLPLLLTEYHGVGLGAHFSEAESRAILAARLVSLARGYSGVSYGLLEALHAFLERGILPLIPEEGSVGASGDLTPLSYVAACLGGRRRVSVRGRVLETADALAAAGLSPYALRPKEGLALMNGTAVMTALACLNFRRAEHLSAMVTRSTAMVVLALGGGAAHFQAGLFAVKPFEGQGRAAGRIRADVEASGRASAGTRLQERYSVRCAPHVVGVLEDSLPWYRQFIETELNSSNDNPIVDVEAGQIYHGGHFYGGHICHVMDSMKSAVASLADLVDRQIALLVDSRYNNGLPANLNGVGGPEAQLHHGLKALQITASACTAEALKLCMPASVFSRSTESHNQDKVSLGTIAARDCRRVLELTEQVAACGLLAAAQGLDLRRERDGGALAGPVSRTLGWVRGHSTRLAEDRPLEFELRALTAALRSREHQPYAEQA